MAVETGYHKLKDPSHWAAIESSKSFNPSVPAERHWLGEGVYFFLEPNGLKWAIKWPHRGDRAKQSTGILVVEIDTASGLDFRDPGIMTEVRTAINTIRNTVIRKHKTYSDGAALAYLFKASILDSPTCVIANFDSAIEEHAITFGSRFLLKPTYSLPPYSETTQIQACILDQTIIKNASLYSEYTAI